MKEHPVLFSAPMVKSILAGTKTQTRRIIKPQPIPKGDGQYLDSYCSQPKTPSNPRGMSNQWNWWLLDNRLGESIGKCQYGQPGDRLLVAAPINGFGGLYAAGTDGAIYSKARGERRPLKAHGNGNGYPSVTVMDGKRKTTRAVHSLVCAAFYGPPPFPGAQVRHLDGNPQNSAPLNLAWGTQADNWTDRRAQGRGVEGDKHHAAKLTDEERAHVRWAVSRGLCSQRHAARLLDMSPASLAQLMVGCELLRTVIADPGDRIPRITLEVTGVRVERLQSISEEDAQAEGVKTWVESFKDGEWYHHNANLSAWPVTAYSRLWDSLNANKHPWNSNPLVWVIEFRRVTPSGSN